MSPLRPVASVFLLVLVIPALPLAAAPPRGYPAHPAAPAPPPAVEHKVTRGETLWSISQKHRTSVGAIMDYNHLPDSNVREGMTLRIPPNVVESTPQAHHHVHVVKRGEDFWDIADHYEIKPSVLASANPNVNPNRIHPDMELIIPVAEEGDISSKRQEAAAPRPNAGNTGTSGNGGGSMIQHTVGENETFYSIGRRYSVPMEAVVAANPNVKPEKLRSGMKVWVPSKKAPNPAPTPTPAPATKPTVATTQSKGRVHKVKDNESIASIAKKYGVSESALLRENKLSESDPIYVDDELKIPGGSSSGPALASTSSSKPKAPATPAPTQKQPQQQQEKPVVNSPSNTVGSDGAIRSYIVSSGEDENTICEAFGISKQALFDYNHLAASTKLKPGDEIAIPKVSRGRRR